MGIEGKFTRFDERRATRVADDMLARVLRDHASRRIVEISATNRQAVGGAIVPVQVQAFGQNVTVLSPTTARALVPLPRQSTSAASYVRAGIITAQWLFTAVQLIKLFRSRRKRTGEEDVLTFIARQLRDRSPVFRGTYRDSHFLLADGKEVCSAADVIAGHPIPDAKEYAFVSPEPYSRKIEVGKTLSGRDFVISVPNRIYQRTAADANAKYPEAKVSFSYESLNGGRLGSWASSGSASRLAGRVRGGSGARHREWLTRQPTIFVRMT